MTSRRTATAKAKGTAPRRAAIYVRISKDDTGDELGTRRQEKLCRELGAKVGWDVVDVYADDNLSAYQRNKSRPQWERLKADIRSGHIDSLLTYNPDRLCRDDLRGLEDLIDLLNEHAVAVSTVRSGEFDLSTAFGRAQARMAGVWARLESEKMSERILDKHAELAERGMPNGGRRPTGYRRVGLKSDPAEGGTDSRTLALDPIEAPIVAEIIERVAAGETMTRIADDLNNRGAVTSEGSAWTIHTVRRVALNGIYAGRRIHKGVEVGDGNWPAIVDEATWRRAVALLKDPTRVKRRSARKYLLTGGILRCAKCDNVLRSIPRHAKGKVAVPSYACPPKPKPGKKSQGITRVGCGGVSVSAEPVEQLVTEAVIDLVESKAFAKELRSRTGVDRSASRHVARLTAELEELEEAKRSGALSLREYLKFRDAAVEQLGAAQARMAGDTRASAVGRFAGRRGALRTWWDDPETTLDERQAVIRSVIERVVVAPVGKGGRRGFDPSRITIVDVV